jgi:hypothetical protein
VNHSGLLLNPPKTDKIKQDAIGIKQLGSKRNSVFGDHRDDKASAQTPGPGLP